MSIAVVNTFIFDSEFSNLYSKYTPFDLPIQFFCISNIPFGQSWDFRHGIGFYLYALMFLAFEVDVLYLYPVAAVFHKVPAFRAVGLFVVFLGILALGLIYAWRKGVFLWTSEKKIY